MELAVAIEEERSAVASDELVALSTVVQRIGVHPETVRRAIRDGRLKAVKAGKGWRIPRAELARVAREGL